MLYKDQTIKITTSCDVWMMTKSVVSFATIVGYNDCHTPRHRIKGFGCIVEVQQSMHLPSIAKVDFVKQGSWTLRCENMDNMFLIVDRSGEHTGQESNSI
ncbi:hypothetical protein TNCV_1659511 [Trichonephila clavipes]|nr:hypothetical protein TNCV_1659511 [Trichonephila clavipes]